MNVRYTAQLARLNLSDEEVAVFEPQLEQVLEHVAKLSAVDVTDVEPTAHTSPVYNVFRSDEPRPCFEPREALANAPRQANQLFIVTKVVD